MAGAAAGDDADLALTPAFGRAQDAGMIGRHQNIRIGEEDAANRLVRYLLRVIDDPVHARRLRQAFRLFLMNVAPKRLFLWVNCHCRHGKCQARGAAAQRIIWRNSDLTRQNLPSDLRLPAPEVGLREFWVIF
jgi:hypothetical protein